MRQGSAVLLLVTAIGGLMGCESSTAPASTPTILGTTPSWFEGDVVQLDYTKQFECTRPPAAGSVSACEMGDTAQTRPTSTLGIPVLYVMVPLGFTPPMSTLHCPTAGNCVAHPADLDVSRVFGAGTEKRPLPPHSHIIIDAMNHATTPWLLEVIGIKDEATWDNIVGTQNLAQVRLLQLGDPNRVHLTEDIPTNVFLFFKVH